MEGSVGLGEGGNNMRFGPSMSRQQLSDDLIREAVATWGEQRLEELRPALETTAAALSLLAEERLEPTDVEP